MKKLPYLVRCLGKNKIGEILKSESSLNEIQNKQFKFALDLCIGINDEEGAKLASKLMKSLKNGKNNTFVIDTMDVCIAKRLAEEFPQKEIIFNSYNPARFDCDKMLELSKKFDRKIISLTMDGKNLPESAKRRCEIAGEIIKKAGDFGIDSKNIIIDMLCLPEKYFRDAEKTTLESLSMIKEKYDVKTILGISNYSYKLNDERSLCEFFGKCVSLGLDYAMVDDFYKFLYDIYI